MRVSERMNLMKSFGMIAVICVGWASAASAQVFYTPSGDCPDTGRFYRAGAPVETPPQAFGGGVEREYGERRAPGAYTQLPDFQRDAAIWSMIQDILEEHLDFAFSYSSHFRGPRLSLGREITGDEIRNLTNEAGPRYFRKGEAIRSTAPSPDGAKVIPADAWPTSPARTAPPATTGPAGQPVVRPGAILIIPKSNATKRVSTSDKVADARK